MLVEAMRRKLSSQDGRITRFECLRSDLLAELGTESRYSGVSEGLVSVSAGDSGGRIHVMGNARDAKRKIENS